MKTSVLMMGLCLLLSAPLQASPAGYDSVVSLHLNESEAPSYESFCNGVLIAKDKVLTAGHCIVGMGWDVYEDGWRIIYYPEVLQIKHKGKAYTAKSVTVAPSFYEAPDLSAEDLAIIELEKPVVDSKPIPLLNRWELVPGMHMVLVGKKAVLPTILKKVINHPIPTVLLTDPASPICRGDSGGALLVNKNGQLKLAGILIHQGEGGDCNREESASVFPKEHF